MYVRVFDGIPRVQNWLDHLDGLKADLISAGKSHCCSRSMALGYESMWTLFKRHNEVWIPADCGLYGQHCTSQG
ncbi:hypothetical protein GJAV_G00237500 [Gymnothorax javanicus]|nr:hypothetical protein GJAV_G00237500 [Gymnothorax javanicus]